MTNVLQLLDLEHYTYMASAKQNCTYKLGGSLEHFFEPTSLEEFCRLISTLVSKNIKFMVVGNMSNILPQDGINKGVFICTKKITEKPVVFGNRITAYAGNMLAEVCHIAQENGLSGLEGLFGIPATVGGAVYNNAGAFGYEISDTLESLLIYSQGKVISVPASYARLDYRNSIFHLNSDIILSATFCLKKSEPASIMSAMKDFALMRATKQPHLPSAGSVFKKNGNLSAGYLIDQCGLKGTICGGAQISEEHANFIVNLGNATSSDVKFLIGLAKQKVKEQFDIDLAREIEYLGETDESISRLSHT